MNFKRCTNSVSPHSGLGTSYMSRYVDDALFFSSDEATWNELHQEVAAKYELSSVEDAPLHLGLTINYARQKGVLALGNIKYIKQLAARFGIPVDIKRSPETPFA